MTNICKVVSLTVNWQLLWKLRGISTHNSCTLKTGSFIVKQHKGQRGPGVQCMSWEGVSLVKIKDNLSSPFSTSMNRCFCFCEELNCEIKPVLSSWPTFFLILYRPVWSQSQLTFFAVYRMFLLWLGKVYSFRGWKSSENKIPFHTAHSCSPFAAVSFFHLDVRWSYATFGI